MQLGLGCRARVRARLADGERVRAGGGGDGDDGDGADASDGLEALTTLSHNYYQRLRAHAGLLPHLGPDRAGAPAEQVRLCACESYRMGESGWIRVC